MINKQIINYKIIRLIGEGGMASVYEAQHTRLETKVAIKILDPILARKGSIKKRFENEAKIMAGLKHQNITHVIDFDDKEDTLAIIMELLEGDTLAEYIQKKGALDKQETLNLFNQMLEAFAYAHQNGIVHRDVKPSNIFVNSKGKIKILDFGIAKILSGDANLTATGSQMGSPAYMSPEQVKDSKDIDLRSDIYSLGVVLFYTLNGKPPYNTTTNSKFDIFTKIVNEELPLLENFPEFNQIIKKATEKNPADRINTCEEFMFELHNIDKVTEKNTEETEKNIEEPEKEINQDIEKTILIDDQKDVFEQKSEYQLEKENQEDIKEKKPKKKRKFIVPIIIIIAILAIVAIIYAVIPKENALYEKAIKENTLEAYEKYIEKYPEGSHITDIKSKIDNLAYKKVIEKNTIKEYEKFANTYLNSKYIREIKDSLYTQEYRKAKQQNSINNYEEYLNNYPDSKFRNQVNENLSWLKAIDENTLDAYDEFIENYPLSLKTEEALAKISEIERKTVIGDWLIYYNWDCSSSYSDVGITFESDGTFSTDEDYYGTWSIINRTTIVYYYSTGTKYVGTIKNREMSNGTSSTTTGSYGCWYGTKY